MANHYLLIGASAVALGALRTILANDAEAKITIVSAEKEKPYNKCLLVDYIAGDKQLTELALCPPTLLNDPRISWHFNTKVLSIDRINKQVIVTHPERIISYDYLLLATGSSAIKPTIAGIDLSGVFSFHTQFDSQNMEHYLTTNAIKKCVVIGGGLTGLEVADALHKKGIAVTIIEKNSRLLASILTSDGSSYLHERIARLGINLLLNCQVASLEAGDGKHVSSVVLSDGRSLPADMVIYAIGVRPNTALAIDSNLATSHHHLAVNESMQTSDPSIYAAGDVVLVPNAMNGNMMMSRMWHDAMRQGMIAGFNMAGIVKKYEGIMPQMQTSFFGLSLAAFGIFNEQLSSKKLVDTTGYQELFFSEGILQGFCLLGELTNFARFKADLLAKKPIDQISW